jgi:uncharacterized repeat protein (TIGR01451 family)
MRGSAQHLTVSPRQSLLWIVVLWCLTLSSAFAGTLIYKLRGSPTDIYQVDPVSGAETLITAYIGGGSATLAQCPDGTLYYAINNGTAQLFRFNPFTPAIAPVAVGTGLGVAALRMACAPDGTLYYYPSSGTPNLRTINTVTGALNPGGVTITGDAVGGDIAFDSAGNLFSYQNDSTIRSLPLAGGAATLVSTVGGVNGQGLGLAFGPGDVRYILTNGSPNFYSVPAGATPTATALSTLAGGTSTGDLSSITTPDPDLSITKTSNLATIPSAQPTAVTYTLVVTNNSVYAVTGTVTDTFPATITNATWTCVASAGSTCGAPNGTGNINTTATLAVNGTATYTVNVTATSASDIVNTASVALPSAFLTDATPANNTASATLTVVPASLNIAKSFSPATIQNGGTSVLTLTINNTSGATLTGVAVNDTYPAGLTNTATPAGASTCGGTVTALASGGSVALSGGTIPVSGSCVVTVNVTRAATGSSVNTTGNVTADGGLNGGTATATLTSQAGQVGPVISKVFSPGSINAGGTSTLTFTVRNPNNSTLFNVAFLDTYPAGLVNAATPNVVSTCAFSGNSGSSTVGGVAGGNTIGLSGATGGSGSPNDMPANSTCTLSVDVTSAATNTYNNVSGTATGRAGNGGGAATLTGNTAAATLTVTAAGVNVSGTVYHDVNHNATLDGGEAGTGQTIFAKLILASAPGVATQAVAVDTTLSGATSGTYSFSAVTPGTYIIILDDNSTLADVTPSAPPGYVSTESANQTRSGVVVNNINVPNQNFGLFNGSRLSGRVFNDNGVGGGGVPNNAIQDGTEAGIPNVPVRATNAACSASLCDSTLTDGAGNYVLFIPAVVGATAVQIIETNLSPFVSTGGTVGTTAGTYVRATDTTTFTNAVGTTYSGVLFADVPENTFVPDGLQSALPGTVVFYPHTFTAGTGGSVSFSTTHIPTPANAGWENTLLRDTNCNGQLDAAEPALSGAITTVAGQQICIIVKETVPADASIGAQDLITVTAQFTYANASPALAASYTRTDLTTVGAATTAGLELAKSVDKANALPGELLTYTITYTNNSTEPLSNLVIDDATPAFTVFSAASCTLPLPASITACNVTTQPAVGGVGAIEWTFTGSLDSSASGSVTFSVTVQ